MRISDWSSDVCSSDLGAPRPARFREDEDALLVVHEGVGLAEIGTAGPVLHREAHRPVVTIDRNDPARAPGNLGDRIGPEMLDDLVERDRKSTRLNSSH